MLKKVIAFVLAITVLIPSAGLASMTDGIENDSFQRHAQYKNMWVEYTSVDENVGVTMKPGEYQTVSPLHWVDSDSISYKIESVKSSRESVVTASLSTPGQGRFSDGVGSSGSGGGFLYVFLHALEPGEATITVKYSTYLTKEGEYYEDCRKVKNFTKTFHVTVKEKETVDALRITATVVNQGDPGRPVPHAFIYMSTVYDEMAKQAPQYGDEFDRRVEDILDNGLLDLVGDLMEKELHLNVVDVINGGPKSFDEGVDMLYSHISNTRSAPDWFKNAVAAGTSVRDLMTDGFTARNILNVAWNIASCFIPDQTPIGRLTASVGQWSFGQLGKLMDAINMHWKATVKDPELQKYPMPTYMPEYPTLLVTLENVSDDPVTNVVLRVACDQNLSFTSRDGAWGEKRVVPIGEIAPHAEETYTMAFCLKMARNSEIISDEMIRVYEGRLTADCEYVQVDREGVQNASAKAALPVYSNISGFDIKMMNRRMNEKPELYRNFFGKSAIDEIFYQVISVACPVELEIADAQGAPVVTVGENAERYYEAEGLIAYVSGEEKHLFIRPDMLDQYQVRVRATGDGTMDAAAFTYGYDSGISANLYGQIALVEGDLFEFRLSDGVAGSLYRLAGDGQSAAVQSTLSFGEETVAQALAESDVSEWAAENVKKALLQGMAPLSGESYQSAVSLEDFCDMLLTVYELYNSQPLGSTAYTARQSFGAGYSAPIAGAVSIGLLPELYLASAAAPQGVTITRGEAARAFLKCVELAGIQEFLEDADDIWGTGGDNALEQSVDVESLLRNSDAMNAADAVNQALAMGVMASEGKPSLKAADVMTREQSLAACSELWSYLLMISTRNSMILRLENGYPERLTAFAFYSYATPAIDYRAGVGEAGSSVLHDFSIHMPTFKYPAYLFSPGLLTDLAVDIVVNSLAPMKLEMGNPLDVQRVTDEKLIQQGAVSCAAGEGSLTDTGDTIYHFAPVYYANRDGSILDGTVYLVIAAGRADVDAAALAEAKWSPIGMYQVHTLLIADQEIVAAYLEVIRPALERSAAQSSKDKTASRLLEWLDGRE